MITQAEPESSYMEKADSMTATSQFQIKKNYAGIQSQSGLEGFEIQKRKLQNTNRIRQISKDQNFESKIYN